MLLQVKTWITRPKTLFCKLPSITTNLGVWNHTYSNSQISVSVTGRWDQSLRKFLTQKSRLSQLKRVRKVLKILICTQTFWPSLIFFIWAPQKSSIELKDIKWCKRSYTRQGRCVTCWSLLIAKLKSICRAASMSFLGFWKSLTLVKNSQWANCQCSHASKKLLLFWTVPSRKCLPQSK